MMHEGVCHSLPKADASHGCCQAWHSSDALSPPPRQSAACHRCCNHPAKGHQIWFGAAMTSKQMTTVSHSMLQTCALPHERFLQL